MEGGKEVGRKAVWEGGREGGGGMGVNLQFSDHKKKMGTTTMGLLLMNAQYTHRGGV